ncbi:MAG: dTDP-glucose 4,6-dehydratase, partial [Proteobacteria bacterium]|nr:dTDP-glucose 4,6-dehydratase [Pseudomonadota bacterium]
GNLVINLDKLTYAANLDNLKEIADKENYRLVKGDICDEALIAKILNDYEIDYLVNFAAESHVDNSISGPEIFIKTNINGTFSLLNQALKYWQNLNGEKKENFRFLHISTDEVYGSLKKDEAGFNELTRYKPNSPYSSSKAASDHLVRAWNKTYGLPTLTTNCSNNFGPRQHNEKLIPTIINSCLNGKNIPIYGNGKNIRDWIFVDDHCQGIKLVLQKGRIGETYCLGGNAEKENIQVVNIICEILDEIKPRPDGKSYKEQISFVKDRLGHDARYAIDDKKARSELGFITPKKFDERIRETINWYLNNANFA